MAPQVGFEPTTHSLTGSCATAALLRNVTSLFYPVTSLEATKNLPFQQSASRLIKKGGKIGEEKLKIGISGSAAGVESKEALKKAEQIGYCLARQGAVVVTGYTTGIPFEAAKGAKRAGGFTVGVSPASSLHEHVKKYRLPNKHTDFAIYTGFGYSGRNLLFIRSTDAVVFVSGRIGTLNEFTVAFEDKKPIGILTGTGGVSDEIDHLLEVARRGRAKIVFDDDPERLAKKIIALAEEEVNDNGRGERG